MGVRPLGPSVQLRGSSPLPSTTSRIMGVLGVEVCFKYRGVGSAPGSVSQMKSSGTQGMNRLRRIGVLVAREKRRGLRPGYLPLRPGSSWKDLSGTVGVSSSGGREPGAFCGSYAPG